MALMVPAVGPEVLVPTRRLTVQCAACRKTMWLYVFGRHGRSIPTTWPYAGFAGYHRAVISNFGVKMPKFAGPQWQKAQKVVARAPKGQKETKNGFFFGLSAASG